MNLGVIPSLITWPLVLGLLLILWGISMVFDRVSWRKRRNQHHPHVTVNGIPFHREDQTRRSYTNSSGYIRGDFAFCSDRILVQAEELRGGNVDMAFGSLVLDLTGCQSVDRDCRLYFDAAFGNLVLQVPSRYRVEINLDRTGGGIDVSGQPDPTPQATIRLEGEVSFGSMKIQYV